MDVVLQLVLASVVASRVLAGRLIQFPSVVEVRSGDSVSMSCQLDGVKANCYTIAWLRVSANSGKLSVSKEASRVLWNQNHLQSTVCPTVIYNAKPEDSGTYYCAVTDKKNIYTGNGTSVFVQAPTVTSAEIIWFSRSSTYGSAVPVQCVVKGVVPSQLQLSWNKGVRREHGQMKCVWAEAEVFIVSQTLLGPEECERGEECACVVEHEGHTLIKTLQANDMQEGCHAAVAFHRAIGLTASLLVLIIVATTAYCSTRKHCMQ